MWKVHSRLSITGINFMVLNRAIYSGKSNGLDNFWFVMAYHTGQYACLHTINFVICLLNSFNVDTGTFFLPKAECALSLLLCTVVAY